MFAVGDVINDTRCSSRNIRNNRENCALYKSCASLSSSPSLALGDGVIDNVTRTGFGMDILLSLLFLMIALGSNCENSFLGLEISFCTFEKVERGIETSICYNIGSSIVFWDNVNPWHQKYAFSQNQILAC